MTDTISPLDRYSRQVRFVGIGAQGQAAISRSRALLCGCGALGTVIAETLVRAGVGFLRIIDRDFVETSNLQRQVLFDETDVAEQLPKAEAAARKLRLINSTIEIEAIVADVNHRNLRGWLSDVDVILDGTDNFETRFLLNDASLETGVPWIYGGCTGSHGQSMTIIPGETACLRCIMEAPPPAGATETCDTAGVIAPAIQVVASLQSVAAMKLLSGQRQLIARVLTIVDVWEGTFRTMKLDGLRERGDCPACGKGERRWLTGSDVSTTAVLCGRNSVQVSPPGNAGLDLARLAESLQSVGTVTRNPFLLRVQLREPALQLTVFRDGRAIVQGTEDPAVARTVYSRYLGG
ncbi:MAG TPA: ThiF family adenylyltransferase [Planctomycetaceae bacterium]|nr:ThiF family adenylyltransferase [Planctomycetaceae bacterium]